MITHTVMSQRLLGQLVCACLYTVYVSAVDSSGLIIFFVNTMCATKASDTTHPQRHLFFSLSHAISPLWYIFVVNIYILLALGPDKQEMKRFRFCVLVEPEHPNYLHVATCGAGHKHLPPTVPLIFFFALFYKTNSPNYVILRYRVKSTVKTVKVCGLKPGQDLFACFLHPSNT